MNQDYTDIIQQVSQVLLHAIKEREFNLAQKVEKLDSELAKLLRLIGLQVISMLLNGWAQQATQEAKKPGLVVHRCPQAKYSVIFGTVEVSSPYLWHKKEALTTSFKNQEPPKKRCGWNRIIVELDGSHVRTGIHLPIEKEQVTPRRRLKRCKRQTDWREVRVGFARPAEQKQKRTFIARMAQYPEVVQQLKSAAVDQGLSTYTLVYGLADGGNGLREALEEEFSHFQFILDRPHLKQHLYATAEAMELTGQMRFLWLKYTLDLIDHGQVKRVISRLKHWQGKGQKTVLNFCNYLSRFRDALHYDKYRSLGLPIGSGEIESAHRYIPQKRLKIPGATWHPDTINPMLALRVIRANDWWSDFWHQISLEKNQPISCC
jgi:hypothetical protein